MSLPSADSEPYKGDHSLELIQSQLPQLTFKSFDNETAFAIGSLIRDIYFDKERDTGILISIRLFSGLTLFQAACGNNVNPTNEDWVRRKLNTVREFGIPTLLKGRELVRKGRDINYLGPDHAAHGGAYPILIQGVLSPIGAIVVSGLSQELDHALVVTAIHYFKSMGTRY